MLKPKTKDIKHSAAGVYIVTKSGKVVGQLRDNKPTIDHPNKISPFIGTIELGETPIEAAWRELVQEETNLIINIEDIIPLINYTAWRELTKEWEVLHLYYTVIDDTQLESLEVYEGQGWRFIESPSSADIVEPTRKAVKYLFETLNIK